MPFAKEIESKLSGLEGRIHEMGLNLVKLEEEGVIRVIKDVADSKVWMQPSIMFTADLIKNTSLSLISKHAIEQGLPPLVAKGYAVSWFQFTYVPFPGTHHILMSSTSGSLFVPNNPDVLLDVICHMLEAMGYRIEVGLPQQDVEL